jgi:hypothetical protein
MLIVPALQRRVSDNEAGRLRNFHSCSRRRAAGAAQDPSRRWSVVTMMKDYLIREGRPSVIRAQGGSYTDEEGIADFEALSSTFEGSGGV